MAVARCLLRACWCTERSVAPVDGWTITRSIHQRDTLVRQALSRDVPD
ncbi:MAG: hypothetical protein WC058_05255 [Phycisphaeraceae bacterium]